MYSCNSMPELVQNQPDANSIRLILDQLWHIHSAYWMLWCKLAHELYDHLQTFLDVHWDVIWNSGDKKMPPVYGTAGIGVTQTHLWDAVCTHVRGVVSLQWTTASSPKSRHRSWCVQVTKIRIPFYLNFDNEIFHPICIIIFTVYDLGHWWPDIFMQKRIIGFKPGGFHMNPDCVTDPDDFPRCLQSYQPRCIRTSPPLSLVSSMRSVYQE